MIQPSEGGQVLDRLVWELNRSVDYRCLTDLVLDDIDAANLLHELAMLRAWRDTVIDACVCNHMEWDEKDARKTLADLINLEVDIALDPQVSHRAKALQKSAYAQAAEIIHQAAMAAANYNNLRDYELLGALRDAILEIDPPDPITEAVCTLLGPQQSRSLKGSP